jgi:hypothetical protein
LCGGVAHGHRLPTPPAVEPHLDGGIKEDLGRVGASSMAASMPSRSLALLAGLLDDAQSNGWKLVAIDVGVDLATPAGELVAGVQREAKDRPEHLSAGEALQKLSDLDRPQAADPAVVGDPDLHHEPPGAGRADPRQGLQQLADLHPPDRLVGLPLIDDLAQAVR